MGSSNLPRQEKNEDGTVTVCAGQAEAPKKFTAAERKWDVRERELFDVKQADKQADHIALNNGN
ncbi:hypothetical protein GNI_018250 [Gregarina niphandrodes]|uniref:Uncharacterized protein n=1 Tax=Gregarina niphandrodes TaxID=110365 RepID=A0A023BC02_GRENI|nr:hypothetical protein GNI_018250 [Gregarina niphandrodes]EZG81683.1 hypothetical protein GNI_018250 [Gregarina niphandrodes]|eukprot:XP_011134189.1 hypothetical protein GNI_018250 [Gregarina niphandrodes]